VPINYRFLTLCLVCGIKGHIAKECRKAHDNPNSLNSNSGSPNSSNDNGNKALAKAWASKTNSKATLEPESNSKKIIRSLPGPVEPEGCIVSDHAGCTVLRLNTSTLSSLNSLTVKLSSELIPVSFLSLVEVGCVETWAG